MLDRCNDNVAELQTQIVALKKQLAEAIATPGTIRTEPIEIEGKVTRPKVQEGTISEQEVFKVLGQNKSSLQPCYDRALKRDSSLHHRKITLTLAMRVTPSGSPTDIALGPSYERQMLDCMEKAIRRWRFPAFKGSAVTVESPLTFTPRK